MVIISPCYADFTVSRPTPTRPSPEKKKPAQRALIRDFDDVATEDRKVTVAEEDSDALIEEILAMVNSSDWKTRPKGGTKRDSLFDSLEARAREAKRSKKNGF